jgi:hypothetical protein
MDNKTIFSTIEELEMSDYFDELVEFANIKASSLEKAMIYFSIIETFAKILEIEFENKHRIDGQKIKSGYKKFKRKISEVPSKLLEKEYAELASWDEIASKLEEYKKYRDILAHNIFIDNKERKVRSIEEIDKIAYTAGESAEEIYNLIIGAREYLEYEFDNHKQLPDHLL